MAYKLATAYVDITSKSSGLGRGLAGAKRQLAAFGGAIAGIMGTRALLRGASEAIELAGRQGAAETRLQAALKATGGAAGFTAKQLQDYASQLQGATTTGDEAIMESMAVLTTFKAVQGDIFKRATQAALDLAATGLGSVDGAMIQLGKALEDPVRGLTALRRSGVSFTAQQQEQIKALVESNKLREAQVMIMDAVEGQVKGVSQALATTPTGRIKQLNNLIGDTKEQIGKALLPAMVKIKEVVLKMYQWVGGWVVQAVDWFAVLANNIGTTWELVKTTFFGMLLTMRDAVNSYITLQIDAWKFWGQTVVDIAKFVGRAIRAVFTQDTVRGAWDQLMNDIDANVSRMREKYAGGFFFESDELKANLDKQGQLWDKLFKAKRDVERQRAETMKDEMMPTPTQGPTPPPITTTVTMPTGFSGFAELNRSIQDAFLKGDDPQKQTNSLLDVANASNARQESLLEDIARNAGTGMTVEVAGV